MFNIFTNPIFRREFLVLARSRKAKLSATALILVLCAVLYILWPRTGVVSEFDSNEIFSVFLGATLGIIILLVPAFTSTAITDEKENQSFNILFTTLLSPFEILAGKLFSSLAMIFTVVILAMPVIAICALSGGIGIPLLTKTYAVIFLATLTYGLLGLALSAYCHRSFTSVVVTYVVIAVLAGATWLPSVLLGGWVQMRPLWAMLRSLSPFEALFALNHASRYEIVVGDGAFATTTLRLYTMGMVALSVFFFIVFCIFILRPLRPRRSKTQQQYSDFKTSLKRRLGFPFYLIDPLKRKKPIPGYRNPVFVAELRSKIFGKPGFIIWSLTACVVASIGTMILTCFTYATKLGPDRVRFVAVLLQFAIIILVAPIVSSGSITDERVSNTITSLRMTCLSTWTVVLGKFKAAFVYVLIFLLSSLPVLFALVFLETQPSYGRIGWWLFALVLSALVFTIAGLFASTVMRTTAAATAASYGFAFALSVVTMSVELFGARIPVNVRTVILTFNPLVAAIQVASDDWFGDLPQLFGRPLWQNHLYLFGSIAIILLFGTAWRVRGIFRERI